VSREGERFGTNVEMGHSDLESERLGTTVEMGHSELERKELGQMWSWSTMSLNGKIWEKCGAGAQ
jgi:hypothetical protein